MLEILELVLDTNETSNKLEMLHFLTKSRSSSLVCSGSSPD